MKGCREFEQLIDRAWRDTASEEEREILLDHLESCRDCSTVFEALGRLAETDSFPEPTETETLSVRRAVIRKIRRRQGSGEPRRRFSVLSFLARPATVSALSLVIFALGFLLGYGAFSLIGTRAVPQSPTAQAKQPQGRIENLQFVDPPPGGWVNASAGDQDVEFTFDLVNQVRMKGKLSDTKIQKILALALVNERNPGVRLQSVALINASRPDASDPEIREALIDAMVHDENPGVRMQAMETLKNYPSQDSIKKAFLHVLMNDKLPGLRIQAINALMGSSMSANRTDPEIRNAFKQRLVNDENAYIRFQAKRFIQENAL
jgi:hypothetical protein